MNVVIPDRSTMTYSGPWNWDIEGEIPPQYMPEDVAISQGYTRGVASSVPVRVPKWAFLLVLRRAGKETALKNAIAAYSGYNADRVRAKWDADPDIERNGATINALGAAIGYTPEQVDQVFRDAEKEANQ